MKVSVIIPTYNEAENISKLITHLRSEPEIEIIVSDGGSQDDTVAIAKKAGALAFVSPKKGRAAQMNYATLLATGGVLYFVHADARPPVGFTQDINQALAEGYSSGCYRFRFDSPRPIFKVHNYATSLNVFAFRGGDQTLFITRKLFDELRGFDEYYVIMEDYDIIRRIWQRGRNRFKLIQKDVVVSARKYNNNSWLRVQVSNLVAMTLYRFGAEPTRIATTYKKMLNY